MTFQPPQLLNVTFLPPERWRAIFLTQPFLTTLLPTCPSLNSPVPDNVTPMCGFRRARSSMNLRPQLHPPPSEPGLTQHRAELLRLLLS